MRVTKSDNRDCLPQYLLTYGDVFTQMVRKSSLFDADKVVTTGFPYLEEIKNTSVNIDRDLQSFVSRYATTVLVTSQWTVAEEIQHFFLAVSKKLVQENYDVGIVFKPHPRDDKTYRDMEGYPNIYLAGQHDNIYDMLKVVDLHSTVYSTSSLEALAFGVPNIFVDVGMDITGLFDIVDETSSYIVSTPARYVETMEHIISSYDAVSDHALQASRRFYAPNVQQLLRKFFKDLHILP